MDKTRLFVKKHYVVSATMVVFFATLILKLIVWAVKCFWNWGINEIGILIKFVCKREYWKQLIDMCNVTQFREFNTIIFYLLLCLLFVIAHVILTIMSIFLIECVKRCMDKMDVIILGKNHQKSLKYKSITLWFIKCKADILFFCDWIKFDVLKIGYSIREQDTLIKYIRRFSLENMVYIVRNITRFFFSFTIIHLFLGGIVIYTYYKKDIVSICERIKNVMVQNEIKPSQFVEIFEILTILCLLGYIILDFRHKTNAYSDLRMERFKELVQMEEKLLNILSGISYSLKKNIEVIAERKWLILINGASELSGKKCCLDNTNLVFSDKKNFDFYELNDGIHQLSYLDNMEEEFQKLSKLEEELKKSSLCYSNIYLVDHQAMLTRNVHFWIPGIDNTEYMKMKFFCRSSMEKWYTNIFITPTENIKGDKRCFSESETTEKVLGESAMLDYELMRAFWLELHMKKYEKKMIKRFKRLNNFSRFQL